jgi:hypothetical protein
MESPISYFHVFIQQDSDDKLRCFLKDLVPDAVRTRVVKPYKKGRSLVNGGQIVPVGSLRQLQVFRTDCDFEASYKKAHAEHRKQMEDLNREGGLYFLSAGPGHDDMSDEWPNVTEEFLRGCAPGIDVEPSFVQKLSHDPTVSATVAAVVGGLILAVVLIYFNLK